MGHWFKSGKKLPRKLIMRQMERVEDSPSITLEMFLNKLRAESFQCEDYLSNTCPGINLGACGLAFPHLHTEGVSTHHYCLHSRYKKCSRKSTLEDGPPVYFIKKKKE